MQFQSIASGFPSAWRTFLLSLAAAFLLASCGGADPASPASGPERAAQRAPRVPTGDELMDWAETHYPDLFPGHKANQAFEAYAYRFYPETGNFTGMAGQDVYIWGPVSGNAPAPIRLGAASDFACQVFPASCSTGVSSLNGATLYRAELGRFGYACQDCHGATPGVNGFPTILKAAGTSGSDGDPSVIRNAIRQNFGSPGMNQFSGLTDAELADLAAFINATVYKKTLK